MRHTEPARLVALVAVVVTAALSTWQANVDMWSAEQLAVVLACLNAAAALATYLLTIPFGPKVIPVVVAAVQAAAGLLAAFQFNAGETPLMVIVAALTALGGEVNRAERTPKAAVVGPVNGP
jgi:NAD/NADP transhydrogenase beta subunit